jgi:hypothetical protein
LAGGVTADTLGRMLNFLIHYGALAFLVIVPVIAAIARAIRDHRHEERGEVLSFTATDGFVRRIPD